jgi:hypothetical protein
VIYLVALLAGAAIAALDGAHGEPDRAFRTRFYAIMFAFAALTLLASIAHDVEKIARTPAAASPAPG